MAVDLEAIRRMSNCEVVKMLESMLGGGKF